MLKLGEPIWGIELLKNLNEWMNSNQNLLFLMPIMADIFVFVYPIFLILLYGIGRARKNMYYKKASLFIFSGTFLSVLVNIIIQFFVSKVRPNVILGLVDLKTETILHKFLPSSSFPSDHAAVSMGLAITTLLRGIKNKDKKFVWFGILFIFVSLIMCFARITTAVHRPTDIIGGMVVGLIVGLVMYNRKIYRFFDKIFYWIGRRV